MTPLSIGGAFAVGAGLGLLFYGGLWFTVASLATARLPALLALASFWIRSLAVVAGVLFLIRQGWQYGLLFVPGFAFGRLAVALILRKWRPPEKCT
jgi:F1F0 ATPase subunit 2